MLAGIVFGLLAEIIARKPDGDNPTHLDQTSHLVFCGLLELF